MRKQKGILIVGVSICMLLFVAAFLLLQPKDEAGSGENEPGTIVTLEQAKKQFATDIKELKSGKYENLISKEFESSIESVQGVYNLEILVDNSFTENTFLENLSVMETAIEKFFGKDIDKSFLEAQIYLSNTESELVKYDEIPCGVYDLIDIDYSNCTAECGYYIIKEYNSYAFIISKIANVKVPKAIEEIRTAPVLHDTVCEVNEMQDVVKKFLNIK